MGELEMELALLREENARLKVERHRPPDSGQVIERMRDLGREHSAGGQGEAVRPTEAGHGAGQAIVECLAMRDGLMEACQDVQEAIGGVRERLGALAVDLQDGGGGPNRIAVPAAEEIDAELAVGVRASSSLAQNAA
jgi:hypothetical protein